MDEDETLRRLREDHERLADLSLSALGADLEHAERIRREAMRALGQTGALSTLLSQQRTFAHVLDQVKPMKAFYDAAGVSRLISESAFAARMVPPVPVIDTSAWFKNTVSPLFVGSGIQERIAALNMGGGIAEQLKAITGSIGFDYANHFAEQLREPLRQWRELFEGYEQDEKRLLDAIVPLGWLISPSMGMATIRALAAELDNHTIEEIDDALVRHFAADRCAEIVGGLYSDPIFEEFRLLLDEGLDVHRAGKYRAAIFVWLAVIDGVASRKFGVHKLFGELKRKNGGRFRMAIERTSRGREALHDALIEILKRASIKAPDLHVPKRDRVMHGRETDFGNERASIQILLVLEVMHFCEASVRDEETVNAA